MNTYDNPVDKIKIYRASDLSNTKFVLGNIREQIYNNLVKEIDMMD